MTGGLNSSGVQMVDLTQPPGPATPVFPGDPAVTLTHVAQHGVDGH